MPLISLVRAAPNSSASSPPLPTTLTPALSQRTVRLANSCTHREEEGGNDSHARHSRLCLCCLCPPEHATHPCTHLCQVLFARLPHHQQLLQLLLPLAAGQPGCSGGEHRRRRRWVASSRQSTQGRGGAQVHGVCAISTRACAGRPDFQHTPAMTSASSSMALQRLSAPSASDAGSSSSLHALPRERRASTCTAAQRTTSQLLALFHSWHCSRRGAFTPANTRQPAASRRR